MTDKLTIEQQLRLLGCSNNGCLVQPLIKGSMGTNTTCSCWRNRSDLELQRIFRLKAQQYLNLLVGLEAAKEEIHALILKAALPPENSND